MHHLRNLRNGKTIILFGIRGRVLDELIDIRQVALSLLTKQPASYGMCGCWTSRHQDVACLEGLGPWLYKSLKHSVQVGLDPRILAAFQRSYRLSAIASLHREAALHKLLTRLTACGIPVILLKGCYLGRGVYADPALRPMGDADLLVREEHFDQASRELEYLGYKPLLHLDREEDRLLKMSVEYRVMSTVPQVIDLHRRIRSMDYYVLSGDVLWEETVEKDLGGCQVFYLSTELNFIHLVLHIFDHGGPLRNWVDLVMMVRVMNLDWDRLMELARSLGTMRPLFWAFRELGEKWETTPPVRVSAALDSYVPAWLEDRVIWKKSRYLWRLAARIRDLDGWGVRLRYCATKLVPPELKANGSQISSYVDYWKLKIGICQNLWRRP